MARSVDTHEFGAPTDNGQPATSDLVPGWLALVVLILLLAVAAVGGYVIRDAIVGRGERSPEVADVSAWERKVAAEPDSVDNLLGLGYAHQSAGQYEEALSQYDAALAIDPKNTAALYNSGIVLMHLKRFKEAETVLWDVLDVAPDHALAAKALGEYYVAKHQYKSALATLEPVVEARPYYADLQYLAGISCEELGRTDDAIGYYLGALKYAPDYVEARDGLARLGVEVPTP
jgi:tetratricopeptide (TPR) repeat protein